ncbi:uncharacterized protein G2W53_035196 [Senna tora]|uniref:Uncharacterized protein n=1 Tax=Senna tora TaxID=362788 RepID=A0A834SSE7_9FABA|nr:uncharacterized protein G2W53_035196 [Senna tora]
MGFSCGDVLVSPPIYSYCLFSPNHSFTKWEEKETEIPLIDETRATQQRSLTLMEVHHHHQGVENEADFWPVEHPLEPRDEDRPVKCPMPESSVINDGGMQEKRLAESVRKRTEISAAMADKEGTAAMEAAAEAPASARGVRKRHHTLTRGDLEITPFMRTPSLPPLPTQNVTIFQMLQQVDKFES